MSEKNTRKLKTNHKQLGDDNEKIYKKLAYSQTSICPNLTIRDIKVYTLE